MKKILLLLPLWLLIIGCTDTTPEQIAHLKVGMRLDKMICTLGEPDSVEFESDGNTYKYVYDSGSMEWLYIVVKDSTVRRWY
mgnify:CR=1 FL=1